MNSSGKQKGVDSLIVTDLIELARNRAISDALLLSGDEDVRIGVQIAQSFGVRVHLLGIIPSRGSQSHQLLQEADTTTEWDQNTVSKFLSMKPSLAVIPTIVAAGEAPGGASGAAPTSAADLAALDCIASESAQKLSGGEIKELCAFLGDPVGCPA